MNRIGLLILLLPAIQATGQDATFSQFFNNSVALNPAFVGMDECLVFRINYRHQWHNVPGGFNTYSATAEGPVPLKRSGAAILFLKDEEGSGYLSTTQAGGYFSHYVPTGDESAFHLGVGAQFVDKSADFSRFVFSDQLDPVHGIVQPTSAPRVEKRTYGDVAGGIAWRSGFTVHKEKEALGFVTMGVGLHHILRPEDELSPFAGSSPRRWSGQMALTLPFWVDHDGSNKYFLFISPQFRVELQKPLSLYSFGSYFTFRKIYGGVFWRFTENPVNATNTDALVFCAGYEHEYGSKNLIRVEYSRDFDAKGLNSLPGGVHEIGIVWKLRSTLSRKDFKRKNKNQYEGECPHHSGKGSVNRH